MNPNNLPTFSEKARALADRADRLIAAGHELVPDAPDGVELSSLMGAMNYILMASEKLRLAAAQAERG